MASHKIYSGLSSDKAFKMLPYLLRKTLYKSVLPEDTLYTLILFPIDAKEVVRSPDVGRAINNIRDDFKEEQQVVIAGNSFTQESTDLIEREEYVLLALDTDFWTDENIIEIRTSIAARHQ